MTHPYTRLFVLPAPPDADNDVTEGYEVGDVVHVTGGSVYDCRDAATGAAVWEERTGGGGGGNLSDLGDVELSGLSDGDFIFWDSDDLVWKRIALSDLDFISSGGNSVDGRIVTFFGTSGQLVQDSGATLASLASVNHSHKLTGALTYYVRTDGSDSNAGLVDSAGGAFLTIQKAVDTASALDNGGFDVTIQVKDGTYTGAVILKSFIGSGTIIIRGNNGTPANVLISTTSNNCFAGTSVSGIYQILDLKMQTTTSGACLFASGAPTQIAFGNVTFGACAGNHIFSQRFAWIRATAAYSITAGAVAHLATAAGGLIETNVITVTITGTPAFSAAYANANTGIVRVVSSTFSGTATGVRYSAIKNSIIDVNGAATTYLPGGTVGTTATGGIYV